MLQWLRGESRKEDSDSFEYAVATILHMCGFRTQWLDYNGLVQRAPDILAFCSNPEIVIVGECTTSMPDPNKYITLKERAGNLREELKMKVYPVMFTSVQMSSSEQNEIWKYDVSIITPITLEKLYDMATRAKPLNEILSVLARARARAGGGI